MNILLKSAKVVDPQSSFNNQIVDIKIENGTISSIATSIAPSETDTVIELENLHISQGWFDSSVCFAEPGYEERETIEHGLRVAAKSGFSQVALEPNNNPITQDKAMVNFLKNQALGSVCELFPIGALTINSQGSDLTELFDMKNAGAIAFGDYKKSISNANVLKLALQYTQDFDALVIAFCQDNNIAGKGVANEGVQATQLGLKPIAKLAEEIHVARNLYLLQYTGGRLHLPTISTIESLELIRQAKAKGLQVTCSVAAHHLVLDDSALEQFDTRFKVLPPLRDKATTQALIQGVLDNTIDCITSDHNPLDIEHKKLEFDAASFGTIGLESTFSALATVLPIEVIVDKLTKARDIFTLQAQPIAIGQKANLTLFTPDGQWVFTKQDILSKSKNAIFLNAPMQGKVYGVINGNNTNL
ncbi:dihydroorotase [Myroides sp. LJL115]